MAWSQLMRCHSPSTSFIGYLVRRSPCTSSRTEAPLAQCDPRLSGLSHAGSWPTQTPFCTSAITVQPTEQCVQTFFLISVGAPTIFGPASALRTAPSGIRPSAAPAPTARPERRRKVRRSSTPDARPAATPCKRALLGDPSLRFINMCVVPSVAIDAIVVLDVVGFLVAGLEALRGSLIVGGRLGAGERDDRGSCDRRSPHHEQAAAIQAFGRAAVRRLAVGRLAHCGLLRSMIAFARHRDSVNASDSSSINTRPTRPTAR